MFIVFFGTGKPRKDMSSLARDMKKDYYMDKIKRTDLEMSQKLHYLDSLLRLNVLKPGEFLDYTVNTYVSSGHYQDAIRYLNSVRVNDKLATDTTLFMLYTLSYCHIVTGNYEKALDCIFELLTTEKPPELRDFDINGDYLLANVYRITGDIHRSDSILSHAYGLIKNMNLPEAEKSGHYYNWYLEKAEACMNAKNYEEALKNIKTASDFKVDKESGLIAVKSMAELYQRIGEYEIAEEYYKDYLNRSEQSAERIYAINNYCLLLSDVGRVDEAIDLCREQIHYVEKNGMNHVKADLYGTLSDLLAAKHDYEGAYKAHLLFYETKDSILWIVGPSLTNEFNTRMARYRMTHKAPNADSYGIVFYGSICVILICGVAACLIFRNRRKDPEAPADETDILPMPTETREQIESMNREMLSLSLKVAENERTLDSVWEVALDPLKSESEKANELTIMRKSRDANRDIWEMFSLYFKKVHPEFSNALYKAHPELSRGEIRMCAFIIMRLSTKDIAQITNRSVRTIESMKYRLHKKLNPPEGISTETYLRSLSPRATVSQQL